MILTDGAYKDICGHTIHINCYGHLLDPRHLEPGHISGMVEKESSQHFTCREKKWAP
jgi:hypothetical protein